VSDPIDIKALDEYLKGGSDISQRYRELGRDDVPPPELDRGVLAEARAAVASGGGGRSRSWLRWSAPLAVAASVVLVVTVVIESGVQENPALLTQPAAMEKVRAAPERQVEEYKLQEQAAAQLAKQEREAQFAPEPPAAIVPNAAPVQAPAAPPPAALARAAAERSNTVAEEVRVDAKALRDQSGATAPVAVDTTTLDSPAPQVAAEQPSPTFAGSLATTISSRKEVSREDSGAPAEADSSDDDLSSVAVTGSRTGRARRTAGPRNTVSNSGLTSETRPAADEEAAQIDPQKWLEEIRELRRAGKAAQADRAWQDFRKAYPQFPVADDDLARKK
jgi:hypothetical protein